MLTKWVQFIINILSKSFTNFEKKLVKFYENYRNKFEKFVEKMRK